MGQSDQLRQRVRLENQVLDPTGGGHYETRWEEVSTFWAAVRPLNHSRLRTKTLFAGKLEGRNVYEITLRYREGITTDMRVVYNGIPLNILSVTDPDARRQWLVLCVEER